MSIDSFNPFQIDQTLVSRPALRPVGTDIAFNFETGEVVSSSGDLQTVSGMRTVAQWVMGALLTEQGSVPSFPANYGSQVKTRIGAMRDENELQQIVVRAATQHNRVSSVSNFTVDRSSGDPETTTVAFTVNLDWGESITFRKVNLA